MRIKDCGPGTEVATNRIGRRNVELREGGIFSGVIRRHNFALYTSRSNVRLDLRKRKTILAWHPAAKFLHNDIISTNSIYEILNERHTKSIS